MRHDSRQLGLLGALAVVVLGTGIYVAQPSKSSTAALEQQTIPSTAFAAEGLAAVADTVADAVTTTVAKKAVVKTTTAATLEAVASGDEGSDDGSADEGCLMHERSVAMGSKGHDVICVQQALKARKVYKGAISGTFDYATSQAVKKLQASIDNGFVDGIVGRETAMALKIWPDEQSLVVHTPKPKKGAKDLAGYPLSSVASAGKNAPPVPANSGSGRRLVYSRAQQRIWAIDSKGRTVRSWLVSGSKYGNETPGTHRVYSKSIITTAWNGKAYLRKMVRWLKTKRGAIGFHQIPTHRSDGSVYQTEAELGTRLSGGCQRQAPADAEFTWNWATVGTKVVVL